MPISKLKMAARGLMRANSPKLFWVSIIFVLLTFLMEQLQATLIGLTAIMELIGQSVSPATFTGYLPGFEELVLRLSVPGGALAFLLTFLVAVIGVGFRSYCLKISRGQEGSHKNLLDGFAFFFKILLIAILKNVFTFLWMLLLFFPALIAIYRYSQAYYILIDDPRKGPLQCIRESKQMMRGNKLDLFLVELSFIGWSLLGMLAAWFMPFPFPIVMIWLAPYLGLTRAGFYNGLIRFAPDTPDTPG